MRRRRSSAVGVVLVGSLVLSLCAWAPAPQAAAPRIDPKADRILRQMGSLLRNARQFRFEATEMFDDVRPTGQKLQFTNQTVIAVRRPNRVYADVHGDTANRRFWYDGKNVTVLEKLENLYVTTNGARDIDTTVDLAVAKYGINVPLVDLLYADPYRVVTERVRTGAYIGLHQMREGKCHHLAFTQQDVDWQIWIDRGARPLPRKVVITYKQLPGQPQYIATFQRWDLSPRLPASQFAFRHPAGAQKMGLAPLSKVTGPGSPAAH
jgi:hypothetical protein